jgi:serine/threonine-protein kinase
MCIGSPSYLAPERLRGAPHDERADLYAVGVILYEMLAGVRPFIGSRPEEIMQHALERPPRPLRATRPELPRALDDVIMRALAKDPARRFADAEEMLSALENLAQPIGDLAHAVDGERDPESSTMMQIAVIRPSLLARAWSWLRYGRWRWRPS